MSAVDPEIINVWFKTEELEIVKMIVGTGIDINVVSNDKKVTKLWLAVKNSDLKMVEYLLTLPGIDVNAASSTGNTALHISKDLCIVQLLVAAGANVDAINEDGNTPIMLRKPHEVISFLVSNGADRTIINKKGQMVYITLPQFEHECLKTYLEKVNEKFALLTTDQKMKFFKNVTKEMSKEQKSELIQDMLVGELGAPLNP
jgi:hypothetical protein